LVVLGLVALEQPNTGEPEPPAAERSQRAAAVRAATRFLMGLDAYTLLDDDARRHFVTRWASKEAEPQLQRVYDAEAERVAVLRDGYSRAMPLGYRVERFGSGSADVSIWAVSLASVGDIPAAVGWRTLLVELVREDGRWRITTVTEGSALSPSSSPRRFRARAKRFREYRVAP
jgi:hypothetical protein